MLMGNICNWLLQGNGAITKVLAYCKNPYNMNLIEDLYTRYKTSHLLVTAWYI